MIVFTDQARSFFKEQSVRAQRLYWSISIKKVGCSGYQYLVGWQENPSGLVIPMDGWFVCIDPMWESLLQKVTVDMQGDALGQKKVVYSNPLTSAWCGCGESFMIAEGV